MMKRLGISLLLLTAALCAVSPGMLAAKQKKVFVNKDMHIIAQPDKYGVYAKLTYEKEYIDAKVYNSRDMLVYKLRLKEISEDTIVYDGLQEHYFFGELNETYRYVDNQVVEHTSFRDGKPIFREPVVVGDTVWFLQGYIVYPSEANVYGVITAYNEHAGAYSVSLYNKSKGELIENKRFANFAYGVSYAEQKRVLGSITSANDGVNRLPDKLPVFPGAQTGLYKFLSENVQYPYKAQQQGMQGKVLVSFVVDKDGSVTEVTVVKPVHKLFNDEAVRLIRKMPKWEPGMKDGSPIRCRYLLPVNFSLH